MLSQQARLEAIQLELNSPDSGIRGKGMLSLLAWAQKDHDVRAAALPIFRASLATESAHGPATTAVKGIHLIAGPNEGRAALLQLSNHPDALVANQAVLLMADPWYVPSLLDLLQRRPEIPIQAAAVYVLGELKTPAGFSACVERLAVPELRGTAIRAVTQLGDPRAIPDLQKLLDDRTDAWEPDGHVGTPRICDLAASAIESLQGLPRNARNSFVEPPPSRFFHFLPYAPLAATVAGVPWAFAIALTEAFRPKTGVGDRGVVHVLDVVCMIPALIGLAAAAVAIRKKKRWSTLETVCFLGGCLGCVVFVLAFGNEFLD